MRDIRADLRERLEIAEAEAKALDEAADAAAGRAEALKEMLAAEEYRITSTASSTSIKDLTIQILNGQVPPALNGLVPAAPALSLDEFLVKAVRRGVNDKEELRDAAIRANYFAGSTNSPGRVVHAKLTNLVKEGTLAYENALKGDRFVMGTK